jgi:hypothetical protein
MNTEYFCFYMFLFIKKLEKQNMSNFSDNNILKICAERGGNVIFIKLIVNTKQLKIFL